MKYRFHMMLIFMFLISGILIPGVDQSASAQTRLTNGTASAREIFTEVDKTSSWSGVIGNVFDSNPNNSWGFPVFDGFPFSPTVIVFSLPSPEVVTSFRIVGANLSSWQLSGSAVSLYSGGTSSDLGQEITISNPTACSTYYLVIWGVQKPGYNITEIEYYNDPPSLPSTPGTPSGPFTDANGSYTISWSAVSGATSYQLQEKFSGGTWSTIYNGSGTSKSRSGRSSGYWYYRVRYRK